MENITLQMLSEKAEPPFLSITCSKPTAQYKELSKKFPVNFNMIILGVPLFESGFLAGVKHCPVIPFSHYQCSCLLWACIAQQQWNSPEIPGILLLGALCHRFLQGICLPSGIWAVLSCCHNEGFQQNWGVSHTVGPAGHLSLSLSLCNSMIIYNSSNDSGRHNKK